MSSNAFGKASIALQKEVLSKLDSIEKQVASRAFIASNYLRNSALTVLKNEGSGRQYYKPNTRALYRASAPGEAPAKRTGNFRQSWQPSTTVQRTGGKYIVTARTESNMKAGGYLLGDLLENGTSKMKARPYKEAVIKGAESKIEALFKKPYTL
ncbi:MAG: hypothetical protein R3Y63_08990 [Eubacteriales bacterium]